MTGRNQTPPKPIELPFRPATAGTVFEVMSLASLVDRVPSAELDQLQQLHFDLVIWCRRGTGHHEVDFLSVELAADRLLHIRSGQVHRWMPNPNYEATLILLSPTALRSQWNPGPHVVGLEAAQTDDLDAVLTLAAHRPRSTVLGGPALLAVHQLLAVCLELSADGDRTSDPLYNEFRRALEVDGYRIRSASHYADQLGCSTRTLHRACQRAANLGPKQLIDNGTALAAQRLLSLPGATVTSVADELNFDEVTNFTKFFKRLTGVPPSDWKSGPSVDGR